MASQDIRYHAPGEFPSDQITPAAERQQEDASLGGSQQQQHHERNKLHKSNDPRGRAGEEQISQQQQQQGQGLGNQYGNSGTAGTGLTDSSSSAPGYRQHDAYAQGPNETQRHLDLQNVGSTKPQHQDLASGGQPGVMTGAHSRLDQHQPQNPLSTHTQSPHDRQEREALPNTSGLPSGRQGGTTTETPYDRQEREALTGTSGPQSGVPTAQTSQPQQDQQGSNVVRSGLGTHSDLDRQDPYWGDVPRGTGVYNTVTGHGSSQDDTTGSPHGQQRTFPLSTERGAAGTSQDPSHAERDSHFKEGLGAGAGAAGIAGSAASHQHAKDDDRHRRVGEQPSEASEKDHGKTGGGIFSHQHDNSKDAEKAEKDRHHREKEAAKAHEKDEHEKDKSSGGVGSKIASMLGLGGRKHDNDDDDKKHHPETRQPESHLGSNPRDTTAPETRRDAKDDSHHRGAGLTAAGAGAGAAAAYGAHGHSDRKDERRDRQGQHHAAGPADDGRQISPGVNFAGSPQHQQHQTQAMPQQQRSVGDPLSSSSGRDRNDPSIAGGHRPQSDSQTSRPLESTGIPDRTRAHPQAVGGDGREHDRDSSNKLGYGAAGGSGAAAAAAGLAYAAHQRNDDDSSDRSSRKPVSGSSPYSPTSATGHAARDPAGHGTGYNAPASGTPSGFGGDHPQGHHQPSGLGSSGREQPQSSIPGSSQTGTLPSTGHSSREPGHGGQYDALSSGTPSGFGGIDRPQHQQQSAIPRPSHTDNSPSTGYSPRDNSGHGGGQHNVIPSGTTSGLGGDDRHRQPQSSSRGFDPTSSHATGAPQHADNTNTNPNTGSSSEPHYKHLASGTPSGINPDDRQHETSSSRPTSDAQSGSSRLPHQRDEHDRSSYGKGAPAAAAATAGAAGYHGHQQQHQERRREDQPSAQTSDRYGSPRTEDGQRGNKTGGHGFSQPTPGGLGSSSGAPGAPGGGGSSGAPLIHKCHKCGEDNDISSYLRK